MGSYIIGLGPCCITKYAINDMNLDAPTLPFDWMFSSLSFIKKVLIDDFAQLLDKNNIRSTNPCWSKDKSYNICYNNDILKTHTIQTHLLSKNELPDYYNFHMWNHYNLLDTEQYDKYFKYVERFKTMVEADSKKLFIYVLYYNSNINDVIEFNDYLYEHVRNYNFLCINCIKVSLPRVDITCSYEKKNLYVYDVDIDKWEDKIPMPILTKIKAVIDTL